jgi:hypothetical protein
METPEIAGGLVEVNAAVAPVEVSVMVSVAAVLPVASVAVAAAVLVTDIPLMLAPVPPLTVNRPLSDPLDQEVFKPVKVTVGVVLMAADVGEIHTEATAVAISTTTPCTVPPPLPMPMYVAPGVATGP